MKIYSPTQYKQGKKHGATRSGYLHNKRVSFNLFVERNAQHTYDLLDFNPIGFACSFIGGCFLTLMISYSLLGFLAI